MSCSQRGAEKPTRECVSADSSLLCHVSLHASRLQEVEFPFCLPSLTEICKKRYEPKLPKSAAQTKQGTLIRKQIRSCSDGKPLASGYDHTVLPTGAVDDKNIADTVIATDNTDMAVVRVKDKITGERVCPCNVCAVPMLRGRAAASAGEIAAACRVIKCPVHKAGAVQSERQCFAGRAAARCGNGRWRSPTAVPAECKAFTSPFREADTPSGRWFPAWDQGHLAACLECRICQ